MFKRADSEKKCDDLVMPIIEENNFELVDVEYLKEGSDYYLRVYADKEGGINIDDCVLISRALNEKLDENDFIKEAYILEVSSPGLGRHLKKDKDFKRSIGENVEIRLYKSMEGAKEFEGELVGYSEETITIVTEDENGYVFYEVKFRNKPITESMIDEEITQIKQTGLTCSRYVFISRSGFTCKETENTMHIELKEMY